MYSKGEGVIEDFVQAHKWMNISSQSGDKDAIKNKKAIENLMRKEQIAEVVLLANKWLQAHMGNKMGQEK